MNENKKYFYKKYDLSFLTNNQNEISSDNETKYMNKNKLKDEKQNNMDKDNNLKYNKLQNNIKDKNMEDININNNQNILNKKNKNFNKSRKNKLISNFDSVNENLINNNSIKSQNILYKSDRRLKEEEITEKKSKLFKEAKPDNNINIQLLYDKIIGYNIGKEILYEDLFNFFFNSIPKEKTLTTNINIRNNIINDTIKIKGNENIKPFENIEKIKAYDFDLEILRNQQIYFFGKIIKNFPSVLVKIYISDNFYKCEETTQKNIFESNFYLVGKIESNMIRTEFNIYKGNNSKNYSKIMSIKYNINILGLFGVREMIVNKYENNNLLYTLRNQIPQWDNEFKTYKLNFNGRVKLTCKKNFILQKENENILQCGKINENSFALDFISPLSPFESFCISITSLISKRVCE